MTTLVGKRLSFDEEKPIEEQCLRGIMRGQNVESLHDVHMKRVSLLAHQLHSKFSSVELQEIQQMLLIHDVNTIESMLQKRETQRPKVIPPQLKMTLFNETLSQQAAQHLLELFQNVQSLSQAEQVSKEVFKQVEKKVIEVPTQLTQLQEVNKTLKQGFLTQQKLIKKAEQSLIQIKNEQQQLRNQEEEIRRLQHQNRTLEVFLKQSEIQYQ